MAEVYDNPRHYEIAFSYRNIPREVTVLEDCARRYSNLRPHSFLELGCGCGPHMPELVRRGYTYIGLDTNASMLSYCSSRIPAGAMVTLLQADMCNFRIPQPVQFAFVALGSLFAPSTADLLNHFACVAQALDVGGLYLLDWCVQFGSSGTGKESWSRTEDQTSVETTVSWRNVDPVEQLAEEAIDMEVKEGQETHRHSTSATFRVIYPQEFLLLVRYRTAFEFVGWWNDWDLDQPLKADTKVNRPIILLRRN